MFHLSKNWSLAEGLSGFCGGGGVRSIHDQKGESCDSLGVESYEKGDFNTTEEEARSTSSPQDTIVGKLKKHCPSLYYSLSAWECDSLDPTSNLEVEALLLTSPETELSFPRGGGVKDSWVRLL
jgi:hypothetical protein